MADQYTEVTTTSWFQRIMNSFVGILFGIVLIGVAFVLLWKNEGRINPARIACDSVAVAADKIDPANEGAFISVSGPITSSEKLGDGLFLIPGDCVVVKRLVEMFAWEETESSQTKTNFGGSQTTQTTYKYNKAWTACPVSTTQLKHPEGHENPEMTIKGKIFRVAQAAIGKFTLFMPKIGLPSGFVGNTSILQAIENAISRPEPLKLTPAMVTLSANEKLLDECIFKGKGTLDNPHIGDLRITYAAIKTNTIVTVFGKQEKETVVPYRISPDTFFYRLGLGVRDEVLASLKHEHQREMWLFRLLGFLAMFVGLLLVVNPINVILSFLPFLGTVGATLSGMVMFIIAVVFSSVTILLSMIVHNLWALIITMLLLLVVMLWWFRRRSRKRMN